MSPATSQRRAEAPGLLALDALSERLLAAAAPVRVAVAAEAEEREAVHRLRYAHVVAHGWAQPGELPADGLERDGHDDVAVHVAAWDGDALVGTVRAVLPAPGRRLGVEEAFGLEIAPRGEVVEVGRLLVAPSYRGDPEHRAWGALFARAWLECRRRGYSVLAGAASPEAIAGYRDIGLRFEVLGPARPHWGEARHPVRLDPARDGAPGWFTSSPRRAGNARR
jgi:hypothetical protein